MILPLHRPRYAGQLLDLDWPGPGQALQVVPGATVPPELVARVIDFLSAPLPQEVLFPVSPEAVDGFTVRLARGIDSDTMIRVRLSELEGVTGLAPRWGELPEAEVTP